ncbi:MAG: hypothetical protein WBG39_11645 [Gordonia sp. (in: high G+C Gram-positive bacteria)]
MTRFRFGELDRHLVEHSLQRRGGEDDQRLILGAGTGVSATGEQQRKAGNQRR